MRRLRAITIVLAPLAVISVLGGCASSGAAFSSSTAQMCRPDPLKHPEIRFNDEAHQYLFDEHVYFSKEGSSGGHGLGGGGCGCN
jgi:hypothetical protein